MKYSINGKSIPNTAIGTWAWGSGINGSKMVFGTKNDISVLKECFDFACNNGFNLWDTAAVYGMGESERILGKFAKDRDIILSDKFTPSGHFSADKIDKVLSGSTEKFNGKIPDIYWLHSPQNIEENLSRMCKLFNDGKIGGIGVSNFGIKDLALAQRVVENNGCKISGVQNHYSLLYRVSEQKGILNWCRERGIPFFAYMVLEQGALTEKYNSKNPFPIFSRRGMAFPKKRLQKIEPLISELHIIGGRYGLSIAETATAWAISKGTVPIIGITKPYQVQSLIKLSNVLLDNKEIKKLEKTADDTGVVVAGSWEKII